MNRRKKICFITAIPESVHAHRLAAGICCQCEKYGYDIAVISAMITPDFYFKDYADGEKIIYNLPDYSRFDGIIIDVISLVTQEKNDLAESICRMIQKQTDAPLVGIGIPITGIIMVTSDNDEMFRELCRHTVNVHGCRDICILTGPKGNPESEARLTVMLDELSKLDVAVDNGHIVYGDFWYTGGQKLGKDIISGRISKPEAVIAASDHMALGLMEELRVNGVRVPEDIRVLGFEATQEAMLNDISLTTIESNYAKCAADAVDRIRELIEPGFEIMPYVPDLTHMLRLGRSCGCEPDLHQTMEMIKGSIYFSSKNYATDLFKDNIDIGLLMESYIPERLTASQTPDECIADIHNTTYIIAPWEGFYLCLREDWLDEDTKPEKGYPPRMKLAVRRTKDGVDVFHADTGAKVFDTPEMLPDMFEEHDRPFIYYFSPMHFRDMTLGYAVLQRELSDCGKLNLVYRNWLRFANNALEMVRSKNSLMTMSFHDKMTGLFNRRGMYDKYQTLLRKRAPGDRLFACVIDMDGLKYINDTFGHSEGDYAITEISKAALAITDKAEICVRAGGDEFFIIGVGNYDDSILEQKKAEFYRQLEKLSEDRDRPYKVSASMGFAVRELNESTLLDSIILEADEAMYHNKMLRKTGRLNPEIT